MGYVLLGGKRAGHQCHHGNLTWGNLFMRVVVICDRLSPVQA